MRMRNNLKKVPIIKSSNNIRNTYRGNTVFVEGINDKKIFSAIISDKWQVRSYGENSRNQEDIKKSMTDSFKNNYIKNQIAIVDKDYDLNEQIQNLYYTDYNDIECTAINLMDNFQIVKSLNIPSNISIEFFTKKCLEPAIYYSSKFSLLWEYLRKNEIKIPYITKSSNAIPYLIRIMNNKDYSINYEAIFEIYKSEYRITNINFKQIMEQDIKTNYYNFRGHDFFKILSVLNSLNGVNLMMLTNDIEGKFIDNSCNYNWIKKSKLYLRIKEEHPNCFK